MSKHIETPTIGEIMNEEFLIPMGLSAYKVAQTINVPISRRYKMRLIFAI